MHSGKGDMGRQQDEMPSSPPNPSSKPKFQVTSCHVIVIIALMCVVVLVAVVAVHLTQSGGPRFPPSSAVTQPSFKNDGALVQHQKTTAAQFTVLPREEPSSDDFLAENAQATEKKVDQETGGNREGYSLSNFFLDLDPEKLCNSEGLVNFISSTAIGQNAEWKSLVNTCPASRAPGTRVGFPDPPGGRKQGSASVINLSSAQLRDFEQEKNRAGCEPRDTVVNVCDELSQAQVKKPTSDPCQGQYFGSCEYNVLPRCVVIKRCGGCCDSPAFSCVPEEQETIEKSILELRECSNKNKYDPVVINATFIEHRKCVCTCVKKGEDCPGKQVFNKDSCKCECPVPRVPRKCSNSRMKWDGRECDCVCKTVKACSTGSLWSPRSCR